MDSSASPTPKPQASAAKARGTAGVAPSNPASSEAGPPAAAGKAKGPALEALPFAEFIPQHFLPALAKECQAYGGPAPDLTFAQGPMPVAGLDCWQVMGVLPGERRFWLCFTSADLDGAKMIALAEAGAQPSLLESFLIDEKKMTLPLLVSRLVQRLNGQKWLGPN
ncbi:MAG: DUF2996 domain-containing protein [Cyanobacteriota bacterium]|jgi:hypothetical protein